jgi:hypothetical protein
MEGHALLQTAAQRELAESVAKVHERLGELAERRVFANHVTEVHNDNRQSVVAHLTQAHFNPTLVHQTLNSYTQNSTRENNFHVHVDPTGHVSAPAVHPSSSSSGPMHPAATRQLADEVEIHGAGKRTKKELKELTDLVPMSIEDNKRGIEDASAPNKKSRASKPIEDRPTPAIEDKERSRSRTQAAPKRRASRAKPIEDRPTPAIEDRPAPRAVAPAAPPAAKRTKSIAIEDRVPAAAVAAKRAKSVSLEDRAPAVKRAEDPKPKPKRNAKALALALAAPEDEKRVPKGKGRGTTVVKTVSKNAYPFALVAA